MIGEYNENTGFICPQCGRNYKYQRNLKQHINHECGKEPQFGCPVCPVRMKHKSNLYKHTRMKHGKELSSKSTDTAFY